MSGTTKMKIVNNGNDLYAIRKWSWLKMSYVYFDIKCQCFWWRNNSRFYIDCWQRKDEIEAWFGILNPQIDKDKK